MKRIRTSFSGGGGWAGLPGHLLDLILRHFERANYAGSTANVVVNSLLQLRLVCKAWRDACSEFSGTARICTMRGSYLEQLSKLLPKLTELYIDKFAIDLGLSPLSALTRLSILRLDQFRREEEDEEEAEDLPGPLLDLAHLPSSLKSLELSDASVNPSCHQHLKCTALTSLSYIWTNSMTPEAIDLLRYLPELQEFCGSYYMGDGNGLILESEFSGVFRCPALTKAELRLGNLKDPTWMPAEGSALRELDLVSLDMSWEWIEKMPTFLTALTRLRVHECAFDGSSSPPDLQALSSLRSLTILDTWSGLLGLAGPSLQELSFGVESYRRYQRERINISRTARLTGLTKLSLSSVNPSTDAKPLQKLGLQELGLSDCPDIAKAVIVPGALTALQTLRLDGFSRRKIGDIDDTSNMARLLSENLDPVFP